MSFLGGPYFTEQILINRTEKKLNYFFPCKSFSRWSATFQKLLDNELWWAHFKFVSWELIVHKILCSTKCKWSISETLWYHFFYWFDVLSAEDSLCSELSCGCIFLLTHTFGKLSCFMFILGFIMIVFLLYLTNRCDNTPLFVLGNLWQRVQLGRNGQNSLHQAWQFSI